MVYRNLCSFYKGEKECPFEAKNGNAGKFWMAECFVCEQYARNVKKQVKSDFFRMVVAYISKWAPYNYLDLIREYLSKSKADEKMKALIASMFSENILYFFKFTILDVIYFCSDGFPFFSETKIL